MAVQYLDYYSILGIPRNASQEEVQSAYRRLARRYHPDVNRSKDAEERFKQIGEAYEVLKDPQRRRRYDTLGEEWQAGQDFSPPPGWKPWEGFSGDTQGKNFGFEEAFGSGGFSDFFKILFGADEPTGFGFFTSGPGATRSRRGADYEAEITVSLEEALHGAKKSVTVEQTGEGPRAGLSSRTLEVKIPPGTADGQRLRLRGQGAEGRSGGPSGDLFLRVRIAPHPVFTVKDSDLEVEVPVTPWEAVLGGRIEVPILDGTASLKLPPASRSGQRFRLRGKGLTRPQGGHGDLYVRIFIVTPGSVSPRERELFEELSRISSFKPRKGKPTRRGNP